MKKNASAMLLGILFAAACGGSSKPAPTTPDPATDPATDPMANAEPAKAPAEPPAPVEAAPPPPPPAPKVWTAKAALTPIKGQKLKAVTLTFTQEEGKPTVVAMEGAMEGLKVGKYHLVVHESAECGANGAKAGKPFAAAAATVTINVAKDSPAAFESPEAQLSLDGESSIVGKTIVLKDDKGGKPNKTQACGSITSGDATAATETKAEPAAKADPAAKDASKADPKTAPKK